MQIIKLQSELTQQGYALMPLEVYFKDGRAKVEIGLAKGKKLYDKRQDIAKRDLQREVQRKFKISNL
jgi:SsrA-binding protein